MSGFPDAVLHALEQAGWHPGRCLDISAWEAELAAEGYRLRPVAAGALRSFGGLQLPPVNRAGPNFANDEPLTVDPIAAGAGHHELARELASELGGNWYPLGEWLSSASVFVEDSGRVVATGLGWLWELGESVEEAIVFALTAHRPLTSLRVVAPGAPPWPPGPVK
ncbi:SUKH-3 domain-containing protein [Amycolatopsis sp. Hca4]|uniref:SUKH-3 domain-containing protein n=1 Tax=Amycolatopsis sp. Hca4 TaxID=2742131 RepID=UPI001591ABBC|nr:SUKH-3 domain-containing protein [Amycolatopsis sp. Hca4]QKV78095.1 SUKH-3 domain-containing protein [Amycolatopsis sp. Hca4]